MTTRSPDDVSLDFFSYAATPMAVLAAGGNVVRANAAWTEAHRDGAKILGEPFVSLVHEADRPEIASKLAAIEPGGSASFELRLASPSKSFATRSIRIQATVHPSGAVYLVGVASPVGRIDDTLRLRLFNDVLASAPVGLLAIDADGTIMASEGRLASLTGYQPEELVGANAFEKWKGTPFPTQIKRAIDGEQFNERSSGEVPSGTMYFQTWHFPMREATTGGAILFTMDVTREVSAELEVTEKLAVIEKQNATQKILSRALDSAPMVLWTVDADGVYTMSEGKGLELLGASAGGLVGVNAFEKFKDNDLISQGIVRALGGEDIRQTTSPAENVYFDSWYMPLRASDGHVHGVMGLSIDATERVKSELDLRQKLELIERQSATIRALATPIIQVWDEVLCLPIIGTVDSARTADMMQGLLEAIVREQARFAIVDLTGVEVVDTSTADHLIQLFRAARVLGVDGILCGIRPAVAQTVVALGLELGSVRTMRSLRDALKWCIRSRRDVGIQPSNGGSFGAHPRGPTAVR